MSSAWLQLGFARETPAVEVWQARWYVVFGLHPLRVGWPKCWLWHRKEVNELTSPWKDPPFFMGKYGKTMGELWFIWKDPTICLVVWNMNFIFHNIWDNPSHWRTHIFQRGRYTTNQLWMAIFNSYVTNHQRVPQVGKTHQNLWEFFATKRDDQ